MFNMPFTTCTSRPSTLAQLSHLCFASHYTGQRAVDISPLSHLSLYAYDVNSSPNLPFYHLYFRDHTTKKEKNTHK
ncbi:hypothetical protein Hanom_Chr06g00527291 [Helianthus anomalus]